MKTKTFLFAAITLFLMIGGIGCEKEDNPILIEKNTIIHFADPATDGCGWSISIESKDYYPVNLSDEFKVDGLVVTIKYKLLNTNYKCPQWEPRLIPEIKLISIQKK